MNDTTSIVTMERDTPQSSLFGYGGDTERVWHARVYARLGLDHHLGPFHPQGDYRGMYLVLADNEDKDLSLLVSILLQYRMLAKVVELDVDKSATRDAHMVATLYHSNIHSASV